MNKVIIKKKYISKIIMLLYKHIKENKRYYLIVVFMFLIGFFISILLVNNTNQEKISEINEYIKQLTNNLKNVEKLDYLKMLKQSILANTITILIIWISSLTIIGIPVVYIEIMYRGFSLGFTICCIILTYGTKYGLIYNLSILLLHNIIFIPVLFATGVSGIKMYNSIIKNKEKESLKVIFIKHTVFSFIMLILLLFSSFIEVYFSTNLSKDIIKFIKI